MAVGKFLSLRRRSFVLVKTSCDWNDAETSFCNRISPRTRAKRPEGGILHFLSLWFFSLLAMKGTWYSILKFWWKGYCICSALLHSFKFFWKLFSNDYVWRIVIWKLFARTVRKVVIGGWEAATSEFGGVARWQQLGYLLRLDHRILGKLHVDLS